MEMRHHNGCEVIEFVDKVKTRSVLRAMSGMPWVAIGQEGYAACLSREQAAELAWRMGEWACGRSMATEEESPWRRGNMQWPGGTVL